MNKPRRLFPVFAGCIIFLLVGAFFALTDTGKELIERARTIHKHAAMNAKFQAQIDAQTDTLIAAEADPNDAKSIYELGVRYEKEGGGILAAIELYRRAAEMGNADAQYAYGMAYLEHLHEIISPRAAAKAEGVKWLRKAAEQGHPEAQIELAKCYLRGEGVKSDPNEAYKWGKMAAESGNARAMFEYYRHLFGGEEWLRKAAEEGYAEAQRTLGVNYHYASKGYPLDLKEAVKWYTLAAAQGDREAKKSLDKLKDIVSAQEEAAQGGPETQYQMALQIRDNPELGGFSNEARMNEALKWYRMAAENGHKVAMLDLAEGFAFGAWFAPGLDFEEAAKWYRKLAEQGDPMGQGMLGWLYATGRGVEKDRKTAVEWFRKGAEQGNAEAQYGMGVSIEESWQESFYLHEPENWKTVVDWYIKAANSGLKHHLQRLYLDAKAPDSYRSLPFKIGSMYDDRYCSIINPNGRILNEPADQYLSEAVKWYLKAVEADDLFGVFRLRDLADMRDSEEAKEALRKLAKNGHEHAKAYLLDFGWAAPEDVEPLLRWRVEEKGNNEAQYTLARILIERNNGVTPEAMELLFKAAKGDYNPALRELVELAANGNKDAEDAIRTVAENESAYDWNRSSEKAQKLIEDHSRSGQWRWPSDWDDPPKKAGED